MQSWKCDVHLAYIICLLFSARHHQMPVPPRRGVPNPSSPGFQSCITLWLCFWFVPVSVSDSFQISYFLLLNMWEKNILKLEVVVKGVFWFLFVVLGLAGRLSHWNLSAPLCLWIASVSPFLRVAVVELWNCSTVWFSFVWKAQDAFSSLWCFPFLCGFLCVPGNLMACGHRKGLAAALSHQCRPLPCLGFVFTEMFPSGQREECS